MSVCIVIVIVAFISCLRSEGIENEKYIFIGSLHDERVGRLVIPCGLSLEEGSIDVEQDLQVDGLINGDWWFIV